MESKSFDLGRGHLEDHANRQDELNKTVIKEKRAKSRDDRHLRELRKQIETDFKRVVIEQHINLSGSDFSKVTLKKILNYMGYNPEFTQITEAHFCSTFGWQIDVKNMNFQDLDQLKKQRPNFNKQVFLDWLINNHATIRQLSKEQRAALQRTGNIISDYLEEIKTPEKTKPPISDQTNLYFGLLGSLMRERKVKIDVARPILNKIIMGEEFEQREETYKRGRRSPTFALAQLNHGNSSLDERTNKIADGVFYHTLKKGEGEGQAVKLFRYNQEINERIQKCFGETQEKSKKNREMLLETFKKQREVKLKYEQQIAGQAQSMARDRLILARQNNELKRVQELITIMREQERALEAQNIYQMLYQDEQDLKKKANVFKKRLLTPDMEFRVNCLLRK